MSSFAAEADGVAHLRMRFEELIAEPDDHLRRIAAFGRRGGGKRLLEALAIRKLCGDSLHRCW